MLLNAVKVLTQPFGDLLRSIHKKALIKIKFIIPEFTAWQAQGDYILLLSRAILYTWLERQLGIKRFSNYTELFAVLSKSELHVYCCR